MIKYLPELLPVAVMIVVFILGTFAFKFTVSISLVAASLAGALAGGQGFPLRHLVEGTLGYLDALLIIITAMIFMRMIKASGLLDTLAHHMIKAFDKKPASLLVVMMLFAMSGGMITGSSTATVLTTGAIVAPVFMNIGISRNRTGAIIAMAGILGMISPPVNLPVMIICGGVDMPYIGFTLPLLLLTIPLAIIIVLFLGLRSAQSGTIDASTLPPSFHSRYSYRLYLPLILLAVLIIAERVLPKSFPSLGMPLVFIICSIITPFTGRKKNPLVIILGAVRSALPVMAILVGVGMFLQIMTLTGGRGFIVSVLTGVPVLFLYLSIGMSMPIFGAVSAYGSASILGVPFLLVLLGRNDIIVASALSLIAAMGDLMPPTALAGLFAAKVVKQNHYSRILKYCIPPAILIIAGSLGYIATAGFWGRFIFWDNHTALYAILLALVLISIALIRLLDRPWEKNRIREEI
jgi:TRAP-type C4-dicarboxylate transport system permease large subunit